MKFNIKKITSKKSKRNYTPSHEEIKKAIIKLYLLEKIDLTFRNEDMVIAINHADYFIRNERDREIFGERIIEVSEYTMQYTKDNPGYGWLALWHYSNEVLSIIKEYFDKEYFMEKAVNA